MAKYDGTLNMWVDEPRNLSVKTLLFLRHLGEQGKLEHQVESNAESPIQKYLVENGYCDDIPEETTPGDQRSG